MLSPPRATAFLDELEKIARSQEEDDKRTFGGSRFLSSYKSKPVLGTVVGGSIGANLGHKAFKENASAQSLGKKVLIGDQGWFRAGEGHMKLWKSMTPKQRAASKFVQYGRGKGAKAGGIIGGVGAGVLGLKGELNKRIEHRAMLGRVRRGDVSKTREEKALRDETARAD